MDPDTEDASWHQLENEAQRYNEILSKDPGYLAWLDSLKTQEYENEVLCESHG